MPQDAGPDHDQRLKVLGRKRAGKGDIAKAGKGDLAECHEESGKVAILNDL
jgi:hypothetical protein